MSHDHMIICAKSEAYTFVLGNSSPTKSGSHVIVKLRIFTYCKQLMSFLNLEGRRRNVGSDATVAVWVVYGPDYAELSRFFSLTYGSFC